MYCKFCGKPVKEENKYCPFCGKSQEEGRECINVKKEEKRNSGKRSKRLVITIVSIIAIACIVAGGIFFCENMKNERETKGEQKQEENLNSMEESEKGENMEVSEEDDIARTNDIAKINDIAEQEKEENEKEEETDNSHLKGVNLVLNSGFENSDFSMWNLYGSYRNEIIYDTEDPIGVIESPDDSYSGNCTLHFWSTYDYEFKVEQNLSEQNIVDGNYTASVYVQGDAMGEDAQVVLYVKVNGFEYKADSVTLTGWLDWKQPIISDIPIKAGDDVIIGIYVKHAADGWGMIDDFDFELQ